MNLIVSSLENGNGYNHFHSIKEGSPSQSFFGCNSLESELIISLHERKKNTIYTAKGYSTDEIKFITYS